MSVRPITRGYAPPSSSRGERLKQGVSSLISLITDPIFKSTAYLSTKGKAKKIFQEISKNPRGSVTKVKNLGIEVLRTTPILRTGFILAEKEGTKKDRVVKALMSTGHDIDLVAEIFFQKIPSLTQKLFSIPKSGLTVAKILGTGLTPQALAALSVFSVATSVLGIVVGVGEITVTALKLAGTTWRTGRLIHIRYKVHKLREEAKRLEELIEKHPEIPDNEKQALQNYMNLYREEASVLSDFAKSQCRKIATQYVRNSLMIEGSISKIAAGTCAIVGFTGYGSPALAASVAFSALATAIFLVDYGIASGSWAAGEATGAYRERQNVAKSDLGIATRVAMLANIENEIENEWDNDNKFIEKYHIKKPRAAKYYVLEKYLGKNVDKVIHKDIKRRQKAEEGSDRQKTGFWDKLIGDKEAVFKEWVIDLKDNNLFKLSSYGPPEEVSEEL